MIIKEILKLKISEPFIFWAGIVGFSYAVCKALYLIFYL